MVAPILLPQALQNRGRFRIPLLLERTCASAEFAIFESGSAAEHFAEIVGGPFRRLLPENLHLEQHRLLPSGL